MAHTITDGDWPAFRRLLTTFNAGGLTNSPPAGRRPPAGPRPPIRAILLDDLEAGGSVEAAITRRELSNAIQYVSIQGDVIGGTFTLTFEGETTAALDPDATAAEMLAALEALDNINPGDVVVEAYPGRWVVAFTGQYAATDVSLMSAANSLTGNTPNAIEITAAYVWEDTGRTETVFELIPVGDPTPLVGGAVVVAIFFPEGACYGVIAAEPRDITVSESYSY